MLISRRRAAQTAQAREPVQGTDQMQRVNWWELLRAGFESEVHEFVLEDESLQLAGRPWRVLSRGSLRIPVVKALTPEGDRSPLPKPQQAARIAAYCRLLANSVGGESPFGIVIFGGTYEGWTVPNTAKLQEELEVIVARAKQQFAALSPEDDPGRPESTSICTGCPHGLPVPLDRKSRLASDAPCGLVFFRKQECRCGAIGLGDDPEPFTGVRVVDREQSKPFGEGFVIARPIHGAAISPVPANMSCQRRDPLLVRHFVQCTRGCHDLPQGKINADQPLDLTVSRRRLGRWL